MTAQPLANHFFLLHTEAASQSSACLVPIVPRAHLLVISNVVVCVQFDPSLVFACFETLSNKFHVLLLLPLPLFSSHPISQILLLGVRPTNHTATTQNDQPDHQQTNGRELFTGLPLSPPIQFEAVTSSRYQEDPYLDHIE